MCNYNIHADVYLFVTVFTQAAEKSITSQMESGGNIMAKEVEQLMKHEVKKKLKQYSSKVIQFFANFVCKHLAESK